MATYPTAIDAGDWDRDAFSVHVKDDNGLLYHPAEPDYDPILFAPDDFRGARFFGTCRSFSLRYLGIADHPTLRWADILVPNPPRALGSHSTKDNPVGPAFARTTLVHYQR